MGIGMANIGAKNNGIRGSRSFSQSWSPEYVLVCEGCRLHFI